MAFNVNNLSKVALLRNPTYKKNGLKSYARALQKFGFNPTIDGPYAQAPRIHHRGKQGVLDKAASKVGGRTHVTGRKLVKKDVTTGQTGEVPAEDIEDDEEYLAQVGIGTPAQTLKLDFDSGSADLWVWSTALSSTIQSAGEKSGHVIFDSSKSSTWKASTGETWEIEYGDGSSASGDVGTDVLTIGGLTVKNQAIETATTISSTFESSPGDGLLGLAWGSINTVKPTPVQTPVENMITQDDIPKTAELFTAYLGSWRDAADPDKGESFYTFGYIDEDTVTTSGSTISYAAVDNSNGFWQFDSASASVNGKTITRTGNTAIADTGTTLCLVDDTTCAAIYAAIPGSKVDNTYGGYVYPSDTAAADLPTVQLAVGDTLFTVAKEELAFSDAGTGYVYGGIQSRGDETFDILGDVFLKNIYAVFDQGNTRFGAIQRTEPTQNLTAPPATTD